MQCSVAVQTDERHVPGAGERHDVVEQQERETPGPAQSPAAGQCVRRVDRDVTGHEWSRDSHHADSGTVCHPRAKTSHDQPVQKNLKRLP